MELQAVTASAALAVTRIIVALFMFGMYLASRRDPCTGYWTMSAIMVGVGSSTPLYGTSVGQFGIWFASLTVISGGVCFWWGLNLFFGRPKPALGWWLIAVIPGGIGILLMSTDAQAPRLLAFIFAVVIGTTLIIREAWRGDGTPMTVGRAMIVGSYGTVLFGLIFRSIYFLVAGVKVTPTSDHPVNVTLFYLLPLMTSIMASVGTLLMYFQRTIAQKDHLATHDDLTRIFNRRALASAGREALSAGYDSVALLLIDVDHFKAVNDTLGHKTGDAVLTTIADTLSRNCRLTDIIGRQGGEEFCIVCPGTDEAEAGVLAGRLLSAVAAIPRPEGLTWPLSVSIGVAACVESSWDSLMREADQALYAAKQAGRNRAAAALSKPEAYG